MVHQYATPIPKSDSPEKEQVRPISLICDMARDYNKWIVKWLEPYLNKRMDPGQFGGQKGMSISQLLIILFDFILGSIYF